MSFLLVLSHDFMVLLLLTVIFFKREFILRYEDLDNRLDPNRGMARPVAPTHASLNQS